MFIGHFAVAFAAKRAALQASLGTLTAAALLPDLIWLVLAGIKHVRVDPGNTAFTPLAFDSYPYSHSLAMDAVWAIIAAGVYWLATRYRRGAVIVAVAVLSHWVLDAVSHKPDMPLVAGSAIRVGLGLWNSTPGTLIVEGGMFIAAGLAVRNRDLEPGQDQQHRALGLCGAARRAVHHQHGGATAAKRAGSRDDRPGRVRLRAVGVVGGPAPERCSCRGLPLNACNRP